MEDEHTETPADSGMIDKIEPILEDALQKYLGVTVKEITHDLSDKLQRPWIEYDVDVTIPYKDAKHKFKRSYLKKLLLLHFGNVSEVARLAGINRRSIHRLIADLDIDVEKIRHDMVRQYDVKHETVNHLIEGVLDSYKGIIHPEKLENVYHHVDEVTDSLLESLPERPITLDEAEREFEKRYIEQALIMHDHNITKTAKAIGLRYETLHRKMKDLGLKKADS